MNQEWVDQDLADVPSKENMPSETPCRAPTRRRARCCRRWTKRHSCWTSTARCSIWRRRRAKSGYRRIWQTPSAALLMRTSGALALVSGRSLNDIDLIFAPEQFPAVGGHGAEMRLSTDSEAVATHAPPMDKELKRRLAAIAKLSPGILLEDKGYSLALHYRLAPHAEKAIYEAVSLIRADLPNAPIEVLPGKCVCEIKHSGFNKATGVVELMTHEPFKGRRPIFIGDDVTDELVFAIMPDFGGLAFSVGRRAHGVAGHFDEPRDVREWLAHLLDYEATTAAK